MRPLLVIVACSCLASCFIGYDSRWGDAERSQNVVAQHATPAELRGTPDRTATTKVSVRKLRAHVTAEYAAQVTDERRQIERLIDDANEVLEPTLGLRLQIAEIRRWPVVVGDLDGALASLESQDPGDDVGWVVGFVGRLPALETSFQELGRARTEGRHFVMRAMNDAAEYDDIAQNLDELDEAVRSKLYRRRVEHKETAVFLHEIGHTLGAPHEAERTTLMNARYDHASQGFSEDAALLMRTSLSQRLSSATPRARAGASEEAGRVAYHRALQHEEEGSLEEAWRSAEPLFDAHPDDYEIQDLRCRLAMRRGAPGEQIKAHCANFILLDEARRAQRGGERTIR